MPPNGYLAQGGGGIETAGATVAINDMLLHSWEGFIRLFPVWPLQEDAAFTSLRGVGAFLVSAQLVDGKVQTDVVVTSEAGRPCVMLPPWPSSNGNPPSFSVKNGATGAMVSTTRVSIGSVTGLLQFATHPGATYHLSPG